jgi:hypothetical protein
MVYKYKNYTQTYLKARCCLMPSPHTCHLYCVHMDMPGNGSDSVTVTGAQMSLIYMVSHYLRNAYMYVNWNDTHARASLNMWHHSAYYCVCGCSDTVKLHTKP